MVLGVEDTVEEKHEGIEKKREGDSFHGLFRPIFLVLTGNMLEIDYRESRNAAIILAPVFGPL